MAENRGALSALVTENDPGRWERKFREAQVELGRVRQVANELDAMRLAAETAYREVLQWWHEAEPDHCGGECFREESVRAHLRANLAVSLVEEADRG